jgi:hypothetical protein
MSKVLIKQGISSSRLSSHQQYILSIKEEFTTLLGLFDVNLLMAGLAWALEQGRVG